MDIREDIRNIAIIAHVDHGKTTLVDGLLKQSGKFRENEQIRERVMDSMDLERERGITILAKNTALNYKGHKINIVDTPGHADFSGEVERVLGMVDGVVLLVDAFEGCMPQTRYVLKKSIELGLKAIVVINKVDRDGARVAEVSDEIYELFFELGATDAQIDFPILYASGKQGYAKVNLTDGEAEGLLPLLDTIISHIPAPQGTENTDLQLVISNLDYDEYLGRLGIGRIINGKIKYGQEVIACNKSGGVLTEKKGKITKLYKFEGLKKYEATDAKFGDIVVIAGFDNLNIGDTICTGKANPVDFQDIDPPTMSMEFSVNTSPFAGKEGKYVTSRHIRDRLFKEVQTNVSMRVEATGSADTYVVFGRGELHLSILIETMRRENFEFAVSRPKVLFKVENGVKLEPIETLVIDVPDNYVGAIMSKTGARKAELVTMTPDERGGTRLEFKVPTRCLMGYRSEMLTDTKGNGIMTHRLIGYEAFKGEYEGRVNGVLIAHEQGAATSYGLYGAQERGTLFIPVGTEVYEGMIVGKNNRSEDMVVNVCKKKQLTNFRASGADDALRLEPATILSLEQSIEFLADDELLEITPKNIRLRKKILGEIARKRATPKK
ncbi:MAG: translational GTPase TypA [Firmicutes bacterium]|nr:translational GTPase TypA [Bacillota bacterium]